MALAAACLAAIAALAGCGDQANRSQTAAPAAPTTASAPAPARAPALCGGPLTVRVTGRVRTRAATELSGLVFSRRRRDLLWTHNDSGDSPRLLAVTTAGALFAEVDLAGARNVDWEDIAGGPRGSLLVGDIGDNLEQRPSVVVYRLPEPRASGSAAPSARYELRYADGPRDAEALLWDAARSTLLVVAKSYDGRAGVYAARRPSARAVTVLRRVATARLGAGEAVTAGDVSADGRTIILRTYDSAYVWRRRAGETVAGALRRRPCRGRGDLLSEIQGEAVALTRDGRAFATVPEGARPALRRYAVRAK